MILLPSENFKQKKKEKKRKLIYQAAWLARQGGTE
jgi:hypothetical protein